MDSIVDEIVDWVDWEDVDTCRSPPLPSITLCGPFPTMMGPLISNFSGVVVVVVGKGADTVVKCVASDSVVDVEFTEFCRCPWILSL